MFLYEIEDIGNQEAKYKISDVNLRLKNKGRSSIDFKRCFFNAKSHHHRKFRFEIYARTRFYVQKLDLPVKVTQRKNCKITKSGFALSTK